MRAGRGQRGGRAAKTREENVLLRGTSGVAWTDLRVGQERGSSVIRGNHCLLHVQGENWEWSRERRQ